MFHVKHSFDISGFMLKIVAILAMTCNHMANVFGSAVFGEPLCFVLYAVGGITFPIMAFLLVEGYAHTSNLGNYVLRLAAFAIVAEIPYALLFGPLLNVLFTLLIGLGILWLNDRFNPGIGLLVVVLGTVLFDQIMDWAGLGFIILFLFGTLREAKRQQRLPLTTDIDEASASIVDVSCEITEDNQSRVDDCDQLNQHISCETKRARRHDILVIIGTLLIPVIVMCTTGLRLGNPNLIGYALIGFTLAAGLLCGYRGRRGHPMKWFFYAYYPLHLFVIWIVAGILP